jgi:hypothetical protein
MRGAGARAGFSFSGPEDVPRTGVGDGGAGKKTTGRKAGVGRRRTGKCGIEAETGRSVEAWQGRSTRAFIASRRCCPSPRDREALLFRRVAPRGCPLLVTAGALCVALGPSPPPAVPPGLRSGGLSRRWDCEMVRRAPRKNLWASSHFRAWQWHRLARQALLRVCRQYGNGTAAQTSLLRVST